MYKVLIKTIVIDRLEADCPMVSHAWFMPRHENEVSGKRAMRTINQSDIKAAVSSKLLAE